MNDIVLLVWGLAITLCVTVLMHYSLQSLDFSKLFKPNSTLQIKIIILFISLTCGIVCALGICRMLEMFYAIF